MQLITAAAKKVGNRTGLQSASRTLIAPHTPSFFMHIYQPSLQRNQRAIETPYSQKGGERGENWIRETELLLCKLKLANKINKAKCSGPGLPRAVGRIWAEDAPVRVNGSRGFRSHILTRR